jgi:phosphoribosylaminoimidazole carboxylase PurE protein
MSAKPGVTNKPVAIIMGSQSDWATMRHAAETLEALGVGHDCRIVSAHRTPDRLVAFAKGAKANGFKVVIAGAGGAAHLPGDDSASGFWRPGRVQSPVRAGQPPLNRPDAGRHPGWHPCDW